MEDSRYFGGYSRFETTSREAGGVLAGADCIVGDVYTIEFENEENGSIVAWLVNKFGKRIGYFENKTSRRLCVFSASGWTLRASLVLVAYSGDKNQGKHWGYAALICNDKHFDSQVELFYNNIRAKLANGDRPNIELPPRAIDEMLDSGGSWMPATSAKLEVKNGAAIVKDKQTATEKLVESGRKRSLPSIIVSAVFYAAIICLIVLVITNVFF